MVPRQRQGSLSSLQLSQARLARSQEVKLVNFGGLSIALDGLVPAPRPWTIAQAMWAAELAVHAPPGPILDLCCGVGQIGLLAAKVSERDVLLVDGSPRATAFAERNAATADLHGTAEVRCGPIEEVVAGDGEFALILADLSRDLGSGKSKNDELWFARRVIRLIERHLAPRGSAILQVGRKSRDRNSMNLNSMNSALRASSSQADSVAQALVEGPAPALRVADMEVYRRGVLMEVVHTTAPS